MGLIADSLKAKSAYSVKKDHPELWPDLVDQIAGAMLPAQLDELAQRLDARPLDLPGGWREELDELMEKRREELRDEDINSIVWDRFDFS